MLNEEDFTVYQKGGEIYSIGMKFDNILKKLIYQL